METEELAIEVAKQVSKVMQDVGVADWVNTSVVGTALLLLCGIVAWAFRTHLPKLQEQHLKSIRGIQTEHKEEIVALQTKHDEQLKSARADFRALLGTEREYQRKAEERFMDELKAERAIREEANRSSVQMVSVLGELKETLNRMSDQSLRLETLLKLTQLQDDNDRLAG